MKLEQENEAEINQVACRQDVKVWQYSVLIQQLTMQNVEQENEAEQANANNQTQTDNVNIAAALFGDPTAGDTQEAELENEARARKRSRDKPSSCSRQDVKAIAVFCANTAVNNAEVEQENEAEQANANVQDTD